MSKFPGAAPPPDGVDLDLENPHDVLKTVMYVTQALTILFVSIFVALRLYAKTRILGDVSSWDDWATYTSYILMLGYCITGLFSANYGAGINQWEVSPTEFQYFFKSTYAATFFYAPMAMTVKLSLLLIIIRVFGSVHKNTLVGVYVLIGTLVAYYGQTDKCMDQSAIIMADAIISVISDLVILLLPTPLTWSLQLARKRRLRIPGMLCAGGIATAFSVYRLILIVQDGKSVNQTIVFTKVVLSGNAEAGIGLICACLPAVNAIFARIKNPSYYAKYASNSRSAHGDMARGEIMMTRSSHVDTASKGTMKDEEDAYELGYDHARLTSDVQVNPRSNGSYTSSRRSMSTN